MMMDAEIPEELIEQADEICSRIADFGSPAVVTIAAALLAERLASTERAAKIAETFKGRDARNLKEPERWETWTDDDGNPIGEVKRGATYTLDYRKGIAAAIRSQPRPAEGDEG